MSYSEDLYAAALAYHRLPRPGKLEIHDQAAQSARPRVGLYLGVAAAQMEIANNLARATLTARANLVAVVMNTVLGLGNIAAGLQARDGGKAVLFKKFAGIDVFDIEIAADTIERVVETVALGFTLAASTRGHQGPGTA